MSSQLTPYGRVPGMILSLYYNSCTTPHQSCVWAFGSPVSSRLAFFVVCLISWIRAKIINGQSHVSIHVVGSNKSIKSIIVISELLKMELIEAPTLQAFRGILEVNQGT
jgi:hypothetical protein